jgi:MSHA pilin protein MshA
MMGNKEKVVAQGQQGFTLVELIVVIVILGILAVVAIPKYIDLQDDAKKSAVKGVAAALNAASAINKAVEKLPGKATTVTTCQGYAALLQEGAMPTGYTITSADLTGGQATCTVSSDSGAYTASFIGYSVTAS